MSNSTLRINSGAMLGTFIDSVISEAVSGTKATLRDRALQEKEKQGGSSQPAPPQMPSDGDEELDLFSDDGSGDDDADDGDQEGSPDEDETEKLADGDVEPRDIVDQLNSIRSGKSFKDDTVKAGMEKYVSGLSTAEKTALLAFLKGIAQIMTGEIQANDASQPDSNPANVDMSKDAAARTKNVKHIQPNVIVSSKPKQSSKSPLEDTSSPTPITPKKK